MSEATPPAECPQCLAAIEPGAECGLCADPGAAHEPEPDPVAVVAFVALTDPRRWGFMEKQDDGSTLFVEVPKVPLLLGGFEPPATFELYAGPRTIIVEPA